MLNSVSKLNKHSVLASQRRLYRCFSAVSFEQQRSFEQATDDYQQWLLTHFKVSEHLATALSGELWRSGVDGKKAFSEISTSPAYFAEKICDYMIWANWSDDVFSASLLKEAYELLRSLAYPLPAEAEMFPALANISGSAVFKIEIGYKGIYRFPPSVILPNTASNIAAPAKLRASAHTFFKTPSALLPEQSPEPVKSSGLSKASNS